MLMLPYLSLCNLGIWVSVWPDIYFNCLIQVGMSPSMTVCLALSPQVFWVQVLFVTVNTSTRTVSSRASFGISSASTRAGK